MSNLLKAQINPQFIWVNKWTHMDADGMLHETTKVVKNNPDCIKASFTITGKPTSECDMVHCTIYDCTHNISSMCNVTDWFLTSICSSSNNCEMCMELPSGTKTKHGNSKDYILKLLANLYDQKQAGQVWKWYMVGMFQEIGFQQSQNVEVMMTSYSLCM